MGDSFYEYLIKSWLQSGKTDEQARRMYWDVSKVIREKMIFKSKSGLTYTAELRSGFPQHKMGHLACFVVGMFALQAANEEEPQRASTMKLAEELGNTCHESYIRSTTRIGPEMFYFSDSEDATSRHSENNYILRPEVIEGFFYLWRMTGKTKYRDWVWDAIQAIDKHCRVEAGFSGINNVYDPSKVRFYTDSEQL
ncbi:glycosyl hydrolase family 47 [Oesophagostomum dentatum]|uniref:alpha-1,2-Mannosidase n=1 Tax=Oesophagostomum dentatum TaxID=61180 RepID=A0A0B1TNM6_OESDE|nr:glycosyl hydrolase family 47 [Oesophagostomum dentatum]